MWCQYGEGRDSDESHTLAAEGQTDTGELVAATDLELMLHFVVDLRGCSVV